MKIALDGAPENATLKLGVEWQQYVLNVRTDSASSSPELKFLLGRETGSYWFDSVTVHRGNAGLITREFENGIVVLNDAATPQDDVRLPGGSYRKILGQQDPVANDGLPVGSTLPRIDAKDGLVLLRAPAQPVQGSGSLPLGP